MIPFTDAAKAGRKLKAGDFKKLATSKKPATAAPAGKDDGEASELAKIITDALHHGIRERIVQHPGFGSATFGQLLQKEIAASFGVPSREAA